MQMQIQLFCMMTAQILISSCSVQIKDAQFCSPLPGNIGVTCDNFLTENQIILDEADWVLLQLKWQAAGQAVECTTSQTFGDLKTELEQLCSTTKCSYPETQAIKALKKIENLGVK